MKVTKILIAVFLTIIMAGAVNALTVKIQSVELNKVQLSSGSENALSIERGKEYKIDIKITSEELTSSRETLKDVSIEAFLSGYDNDEKISDKTSLFDVEYGTTYIKSLNIKIPEDIEQDSYLLRILVSDRNNNELIQNFRLKIDAPRHKLLVKDFILQPAGELKAGTSLLAKARIQNLGQKDQSNVKVTITVPELGVEGSYYINEIKSGQEKDTEEIYMNIPRSAKSGVYEVTITAKCSQYSASEVYSIKVRASEEYSEQKQSQISIAVVKNVETVKVGEIANYPIAITNSGKNSITVIISSQTTSWAETTISDSAIVIEPSKTVTSVISVVPGKNIPAGVYTSAVELKIGDFQEQVMLTTNVAKKDFSVKGALETTLIIFIVLLIMVGIVMGLTKLHKKEDYY